MRLVTFRAANGSERPGTLIEDDGAVVDLAARSSGKIPSLLALIEGGVAALEFCGRLLQGRRRSDVLPTASVRLLAPLPVPPSIRDFLCFEAHYKKAYEELFKRIAAHEPDPAAAYESYRRAGKLGPPPHWYDRPTYGLCNRFAVVGPDAEIRRPIGVRELDYELELACVIGAPGRNIAAGDAAAHIFGYTILNDFSARDLQAENMRRGEGGRGSAKEFDTGYALGPCIVTADEIGDPYALEMVARVNGSEWSRGNSRDMYHGFGDLIAAASVETTLHPGEILGSGTVGGGCGLELGRFLQDGDTVELEIEKIGVLRNRIARTP
jgi:2-keto-4-pentenoate hydratase/2-oxohepta-3-ene-1,7-dioic acid hydratase in catechol pathway